MKKLLLATTMIVAGAAMAHAEVTLSGDGRLGLLNDNGTTTFSSRARVAFKLAGTSDSGLSFGGSFRADNAGDAASGTAGSVFVSGAFGKVEIGDVDPADKAAVGNVSGVGYTGLSDVNEIYYYVVDDYQDTPALLYTYSADALTVYAGSAQLDAGNDAFELGATYSFGDSVTAAIGYASVPGDGGVQWTAGLTAKLDAFTVKVITSSTNSYLDENGSAISVDYTTGPTTLTAFYTSNNKNYDEAVGAGVSYDLGGGATLAAGYANAGGTNAYDLGIKFKF